MKNVEAIVKSVKDTLLAANIPEGEGATLTGICPNGKGEYLFQILISFRVDSNGNRVEVKG
jgi:hypothetical protein